MDKRRFIDQLPEVHQTETLKKFFGATVDEMFQPGRAENLSGYIGSKPSYYNPDKDFYKPEPSAERTAYQLEPTLVSQNDGGAVTNLLSYDDLINYLQAENANTADHNRLFGDDFYGWVPPVDLDKLNNYRQYFWFGDVPSLLPTVVLTVDSTNFTADGSTYVYALPAAVAGVDASRESPCIFVDGLPGEFVRVGDALSLVQVPGAGADIRVFRYADLTAVLEGLTSFDPRPFNADIPLTALSSNMRLRFEDGISYFQGFGRMPYEQLLLKVPNLCKTIYPISWDSYTRPSEFFVEGVGSSIVVVPYPDRMTFLSKDPYHYVIDRRDRVRSPWTVNNFWVHESAFRWAGKSFSSRRARRPIVEILPNLELFNYGTHRIEEVTCTLTGDPLYCPVILDRPDASMGISDWGILDFDKQPVESAGAYPLALRTANGKRPGQLFVDGGQPIGFGDRILVLQNDAPDLNGAILTVRRGQIQDGSALQLEESGGTDLILTETGGFFQLEKSIDPITGLPVQAIDVMVLMPDAYPIKGDITALPRGRYVKWDAPSGNDAWFLANAGQDLLPWEYMSDRAEYVYDGEDWSDAQAPHTLQPEPLFSLYTDQNVRHDGLPASTFVGNRLFGYTPATVETGVLDSVLNRYVIPDAKDSSQITFQFDQAVVRATSNGAPIPGFQWFKSLHADGTVSYSNSWYPTGERSRQNLVNGLFDVPPNLVSNANNEEVTTLSRNQWLDNFTSVFLRQPGFVGSAYNINNWRDTVQTLGTGFSGPAWTADTIYAPGTPVTYLGRVYTCAIEHISGATFDATRWTARPIHSIVQSKSPLLRTMLLASDARFDYLDATRYVDSEYARFRNKFRTMTTQVRTTGQRIDSDDKDLWVETVLTNLKTTKTPEFPFALSSMAGGTYFIPATAAQMGILSVYQPGYEYDDTYAPAALFLRGHDGSRTPVTGSFEDDVLLALELRIWRSILPQFKSDAKRPFDFDGITDGKWRGDGKGNEGTTGSNPCNVDPIPVDTGSNYYTPAEIARIYTPIFLRYAQLNNIDYQAHNDYIGADPFTWNYRGYQDVDGVEMPGCWRAIYRFYFDTDRPHATPWEMLGFAQKPSWWDRQYGAAPYTAGNVSLWEDLRDGRVRQGVRAGIDQNYVRPDLLRFLPVDQDGKLLNPMQIGMFAKPPSAADAARPWFIGDGGPGEQFWMNSASYRFAKCQFGYLMRPAEWIELTWDSQYVAFAADGQVINTRVHRRPRAVDTIVHGEVSNTVTLDRYANLGIQQWISDMMASRNQKPSVLGDAMRAMHAQLAHKMAGFTQRENMRIFADNFGILPTQDVQVVLHTSPPIREAVYSGVIIEWDGNGYKVVGYDTDKEGFCINPGDPNSAEVKISLGNDPVIYEWHMGVYYPMNILVDYEGTIYRCILAHTSSSKFDSEYWTPEPRAATTFPKVIVYANGTGGLTYVPYGTVFKTVQEVAQFLWDYGRGLGDEGFIFDYIDPKTGAVVDWNQMILDFLAWAQMNWQPGSFLALSPGASQLKFRTAQGYVLNLETSANGIYGLLDRTGRPVAKRNSFVSRLDEETKVITLTNDLFCARMRVTESEHVVLLSNTTIFGDIIYSPLYSLRQPRLRLYALRTMGWTGRISSAGFMIEDNTVQFNFWAATENLRTMFEVEGSEDQDLRDYSRHVVGYQKRPYLDDLLISETEQFEFYQGMIRAKGAPTVYERLTRSNVVDQQSDLKFLEEWGFRVGRFGATDTFDRVGFTLARTDMRANPQLIEFGNLPIPYDGVVQIPADSIRWVEAPSDVTTVFPSRALASTVNNTSPDATQPYARALSTGGPVRLDEITYSILAPYYVTALYESLQNEGKLFSGGQRLWIYDMQEPVRRYDVLRADYLGDAAQNYARLIEVQTTDNGDSDLSPGTQRLIFDSFHNLTQADVGRLMVVPFSIAPTPDVDGMHYVIAIDSPYSVLVPYKSEVLAYERQPYCMVLRSVHFATTVERDAFNTAYGFQIGELCYVDSVAGHTGWVVFQRVAPTPASPSIWTVYREQPVGRTDSYRLRNTLIYDINTEITNVSLSAQALKTNRMTIVDPIVGNVSGEAEREISYRMDNDPAIYSTYDGMWGDEHVGKLWWDTSIAVFLETTTDVLPTDDEDRYNREMTYRVENWGKVAPGCSINIWEWTRSLTDPVSQMQDGNTATLSPSYNTVDEFDATVNQNVTAYYYWSLNPAVVPNVAGREMSALQVSSLIVDPRAAELPWVAPISNSAMLLCNVEEFLNDTSTVVQFEVTKDAYDGVVHSQYALSRKGDDDTMPPDQLYTILRNSLVGFDDFIRAVPDGGLTQFNRVGASLRERRTMFDNGRDGLLAARRSFITRLNTLLFESPIVIDQPSSIPAMTMETPFYNSLIWSQPDGADWIEPPPRGSYDFVVNDMDERRALLSSDAFLRALGFDSFASSGYDKKGWDYDFATTKADLPNYRLPRVLVSNYETGTTRPGWSIWQAQPVLRTGNAPFTLVPLFEGNLPPVAVDDRFKVEPGATVKIYAPDLLVNDRDPDGDPLAVTSVGPASPADGIVLQIDRMTWVFVPAETVTYPVVFSYAITDGRRGTASANIHLHIDCDPNDGPLPTTVARADIFTVKTGETLTMTAGQLLLNDSGAGISLISAAQPAHGKLTYTSASVVYTPPQDSTILSDSFTYTIKGSDGGVSMAEVAISISGPPPVAKDLIFQVPAGSTSLFPSQVILSQATGTSVELRSVREPKLGSAVLELDGVIYTAPEDMGGKSDVMTYVIIDAYDRTATGKIYVDITGGSGGGSGGGGTGGGTGGDTGGGGTTPPANCQFQLNYSLYAGIDPVNYQYGGDANYPYQFMPGDCLITYAFQPAGSSAINFAGFNMVQGSGFSHGGLQLNVGLTVLSDADAANYNVGTRYFSRGDQPAYTCVFSTNNGVPFPTSALKQPKFEFVAPGTKPVLNVAQANGWAIILLYDPTTNQTATDFSKVVFTGQKLSDFVETLTAPSTGWVMFTAVMSNPCVQFGGEPPDPILE